MSRPGGSPRRWGRGTLQLRLTAGVIVLLTLASAAIVGATALGLRSFLIGQLDAQLATASARYAEYLHGPPDDGDETGDGNSPQIDLGEVPGLTAGTLAVRVSEEPPEQGYVIAQGLVGLTAADAAALAAQPAGGPPQTLELAGGSYRVAATSLGSDEMLVIGVPLSELSETMARLLAVEAVVLVVVIALGGVAGGWFVSRSLRPLRRVAATATRVVELPLGAGAVTVPDRVTGVDPESEAGQVGHALNLLLDHVESAIAQRQATEDRLRRFIADASHELRTPVAVISGYSELARRQPDPLPPTVGQALERIGTQSRRMGLLVDDLLLLARLDSGRPLVREELDLTRLVLDVVEDARVAGPDHRWHLELPEEPMVIVGDQHRLHQVLANLAANARIHTPPGTTVTVSLQQSADEVAVLVRDDGPGIPTKLQGDVFGRFVRGDESRSQASGSSGLGLAIVSAVVAAHGGRAAVTSQPGDTCFTVTLPAQPIR